MPDDTQDQENVGPFPQNLRDRTKDICSQLERYGEVWSHELADLLWSITDLNDDLTNGRDISIIREDIQEIRELVEKIAEKELK